MPVTVDKILRKVLLHKHKKADISDLGTIPSSHTELTDIGSNTHDQIDSHISDTDNPHSVTASQVGAVALTGNETIGGIKTFSSSPIVPTPTTDFQTATKKYVDDNAGGGGSITVQDDSGTPSVSSVTTLQFLTGVSNPSAGVALVDNINNFDCGTFTDPQTDIPAFDGGAFV